MHASLLVGNIHMETFASRKTRITRTHTVHRTSSGVRPAMENETARSTSATLAELLTDPSLTPEREAFVLAQLAQDCFAAGFYNHALRAYYLSAQCCQELFADQPHFLHQDNVLKLWANASLSIVTTLLSLHRVDEAQRVCSSAIKNLQSVVPDPRHRCIAHPCVVAASKFLLAKQFDAAAQCLHTAIGVLLVAAPSPSHSTTDRRTLAMAYMSLGSIYETHEFVSEWMVPSKRSITSDECADCAIAYFRKALSLDDNLDDAHSGLANMLVRQGNFEEAIVYYSAAYSKCSQEAKHRDAKSTHTFNLAQCFQHLCCYEEAIHAIDTHIEMTRTQSPVTIADYALRLILAKLLFAGGKGYMKTLVRVPSLLDEISRFPLEVISELRLSLKTHWAYSHFLRMLLSTSTRVPVPWTDANQYRRMKKLPMVGDSHCLSLAWQRVPATNDKKGKQCLLCPHVVTGLMAWHVVKGAQDFSKFTSIPFETLKLVLSQLKNTEGESRSPCLFFAGEIDCRMGIEKSVSKGKYNSLLEGVQQTAKKYIDALKKLAHKYGLFFYVFSITPPAKNSLQHGKATQLKREEIVHLFNAAIRTVFMDDEPEFVRFVDISADLTGGSTVGTHLLRPEFVADGTHANANILPIAERGMHNNFLDKHRKEYLIICQEGVYRDIETLL